ncbi:MAG TPA: Ig-like domain-containing protein [Kofleriaceae bacterium]
MSRRLGVAVLLLIALTVPAAARPQTLVIDQPIEAGQLTEQGLVPYNTIFLNRCASGCLIKVGGSSSITDSWQIASNSTLTPFPWGDAAWQQVVSCVKDVFEPYNVNITDVDPGTANHFEVMIAGSPTDVGMATTIGGVAPGQGTSCTSYLNNALVFDFAKVWGPSGSCGTTCIEDICATAAQEIGHTWQRLDHVIVNEDPMTYFNSQTRKYFQNVSAQCGSDCTLKNGVWTSPTGMTCNNNGGTTNQSHNCICGGATQNSHSVITGLFGAGPGSPPMVTITDPKPGQSVSPGFAVRIEAVDNSLVTKVELRIDGQLLSMLATGPYVFNAPTTLADGTHKVEVTAYDPHNTPGKATVDVVIGPPCEKPSDCTLDTDTCVGGRCVPGSGVQGGLGTTCTVGTDCASGQCGMDGTASYCVEQCAIGECPDGFGCAIEDGMETGVCWPGFDDGSGGCGCESNRGGPFGMFVLIGWLVLTCRKRRARS